MGIPTRRRGRTRLIAGALLALLIVAGVVAGGAAARTHKAVVAVGPDPVLASGVAPAGVANGFVTALVHPDLKQVGATGQVTTLASAPIDASGNFTLTANPAAGAMAAAVARADANNGGWLNMDLVETGANGEVVVQGASRQYASSGQMVPLSSIQSVAPAAAASLGSWRSDPESSDGGTTTVDPSEYAVVTKPSAAAAQRAASRIMAANAAVPAAICIQTSTLDSQADVDTVVGEMHTSNDMVKGLGATHFAYGGNADTNLDYGIEQTLSGPWQLTGSIHIGNTGGSGSSVADKRPIGSQFGWKLRSGFLHQKWHYTYCGSYWYQTDVAKWTEVPDALTNPPDGPGVLTSDYNHNLDNNCANASAGNTSRHVAGDQWSRTTNAYNHFDLGFNVFGFQGGTQSGASQWVTMTWQWSNALPGHTYYLCGNDNDPGHAHRIYAGY